MPKRPDFILQITVRNIEDFSPDAVVKSPRTFRPVDVQTACRNLELAVAKGTPELALSLTQFILMDYFAIAHSTGLYNRQIKLWESIPRIQTVEIYQTKRGIFGNNPIPEFDIIFLDNKKRPVLAAYFLKPSITSEKVDYLRSFREFVKRASLYQNICGLFVCFTSPFSEKVVELVMKETNASKDIIARYESKLTKPEATINLLEMDSSTYFDPTTQTNLHKINLLHPRISKKKAGNQAMPAVNFSDQIDNELSETEI